MDQRKANKVIRKFFDEIRDVDERTITLQEAANILYSEVKNQSDTQKKIKPVLKAGRDLLEAMRHFADAVYSCGLAPRESKPPSGFISFMVGLKDSLNWRYELLTVLRMQLVHFLSDLSEDQDFFDPLLEMPPSFIKSSEIYSRMNEVMPLSERRGRPPEAVRAAIFLLLTQEYQATAEEIAEEVNKAISKNNLLKEMGVIGRKTVENDLEKARKHIEKG